MGIKVKNKSNVDIEVDDLGITLPTNEIYDLSSDSNLESSDLTKLVEERKIVYVNDTNPDNIVEFSYEDSMKIAKTEFNVDTFYSKDEVDKFLVNKVEHDSVYLKSQSYSKTEIDSKISELVNSAPDALNTLNELSAALGNDSNFAQNITNEIGKKADKSHNHDGSYYDKNQVNNLIENKANINHNHNGQYAVLNHSHGGQYASANHTHGQYSLSGHDHNGQYAPNGHNHDDRYSPTWHNHDGLYVTQSQIQNLINTSKFGQNYKYAENSSVSTTTSSNWQEKLRLNVNINEWGRYRIGYSYNWNGNSISRDFMSQVYCIETGVEIGVHQQEPKDSAGTFGSTGSNQKHLTSGFRIIDLNPGNYNFILNYTTSESKYHASIWNVRMEFWRVQ